MGAFLDLSRILTTRRTNDVVALSGHSLVLVAWIFSISSYRCSPDPYRFARSIYRDSEIQPRFGDLILKRQANKHFFVVSERPRKPGGLFDTDKGSPFFNIANRLTSYS